jgi:DNA replication initiation complex subunit (GINS family)
VYDELYAAWRFELENAALGGLPSNFYVRAADYLKHFNEETRLLDKKNLKSKLLERELERVKCMLQELIWTRYKKLVASISESKKLPSGLLTDEEESLCTGFLSFAESYQKFADKLLEGQISTTVSNPVVDMKTYGPFMVEDVASVPVENAKILVKQGLAENVELS